MVWRISRHQRLFVEFISLKIDQFKEDTIHFIRVDKGKFATFKGPRAADEWISFGLKLIHGLTGIVDIQADQHNAFAFFFNEFCHFTVRGGGFHQFKPDISQAVSGNLDLEAIFHEIHYGFDLKKMLFLTKFDKKMKSLFNVNSTNQFVFILTKYEVCSIRKHK